VTEGFATLFTLGRLFATPGAILAAKEAKEANDNLILYLYRHAAGDRGDLSQDDMQANATALQEGTRLLSAYHIKDGKKIGVITEADRSATTILLPEEY
jgi:hypothetical protein